MNTSIKAITWGLVLSGFAVLGSTSSAAALDDPTDLDGYVKIDWKSILDKKEPTITVRLDPPLLRMMASAAKDADEEIVELVNDLAFVRVEVYEDIDDDVDLAEEVVDAVADLEDDGWSTVVKVREDGSETVDILMKSDGETISGFVVCVTDSSEFVFVNIAGEIDPDSFGGKLGKVAGRLMEGKLDFEELGDLMEDSLKSVR